MSPQTCRERSFPAVPCHLNDPDLWFAENPMELERAKVLCAECPIRRQCLAEALERQEPWGVWGGEIIDRVCEAGRADFVEATNEGDRHGP